jgi:hypothetical protein
VLDHLLMELPAGWGVARKVVADTYGSDHHPVAAEVFAAASASASSRTAAR